MFHIIPVKKEEHEVDGKNAHFLSTIKGQHERFDQGKTTSGILRNWPAGNYWGKHEHGFLSIGK